MYIETAHGVHIKLVSLCVFFFCLSSSLSKCRNIGGELWTNWRV